MLFGTFNWHSLICIMYVYIYIRMYVLAFDSDIFIQHFTQHAT